MAYFWRHHKRHQNLPDHAHSGGSKDHAVTDASAEPVLDDGASDTEPLLKDCPDLCKLHSQGTSVSDSMHCRKQPLVLAALFLIWAIGATALFLSMGLGPTSILYLMVQIITTVGWGDLVPETQGQRLACAFVVLGSALVVANVIMVAIDAVLDAQAEMLSQAMAAKEEEIRRDKEQEADRFASGGNEEMSAVTAESRRIEERGKGNPQVLQLVNNTGLFLACLLIGVLFFGIYEACSCERDGERIEGCARERCHETGGFVKTWVDAFYMSVVTMTTVGFGDLCAETPLGQVFSIFWMLVGVAATINFIGSFYDVCINFEAKNEKSAKVLALFEEFDDDGNGQLSKIEFLKMQLVQNELVTPGQFDSLVAQFHNIAGADEKISWEEYCDYYLDDELHSPSSSSRQKAYAKLATSEESGQQDSLQLG